MSPHLKAFVVVFVISTIGLVFFRRPFADVVGAATVDRWRNLWLAAAAILFLVPNFWVFVILTMAAVAVISRSEPLKPAAFLVLLFFAPAYGDAIPGFAGINKFIVVTPPLVLSVVLLMPLLLSGRAMKRLAPVGGGADLFFLLYMLLLVVLSTRAQTFTHMLRTCIEQVIAMAPIYYVFSRTPKSLSDIRTLSAAYVLPVLILAMICVPEFLKNWHLYTTASAQWFGSQSFSYVMRDGFLRTSASVIDPILWGSVCMTAIGVGLALFSEKFSRPYRYLSFALLAFGLIVSFSRGPWLGAFVTIGTFLLVSPRAPQRIMQAGAGGAVALLVSMATPFGRKIIDLLPFIGDSATSTISYRQQLLRVAQQVMAENPFLGSGDYMNDPRLEALRQGQGIIDIVNSYLEVGLASGYVGLGLFVGFFAFALKALLGAINASRNTDPQMSLYCRAYFATLVGLLVTIFTTSSVLHIPSMYWLFGALAVALARIEHYRRTNPAMVAGASPSADDNLAFAKPKFDWK